MPGSMLMTIFSANMSPLPMGYPGRFVAGDAKTVTRAVQNAIAKSPCHDQVQHLPVDLRGAHAGLDQFEGRPGFIIVVKGALHDSGNSSIKNVRSSSAEYPSAWAATMVTWGPLACSGSKRPGTEQSVDVVDNRDFSYKLRKISKIGEYLCASASLRGIKRFFG